MGAEGVIGKTFNIYRGKYGAKDGGGKDIDALARFNFDKQAEFDEDDENRDDEHIQHRPFPKQAKPVK